MTLNTENWKNEGGLFVREDEDGHVLAIVYLTENGWTADIEPESWGYEDFEGNFEAMAWADEYIAKNKITAEN